MPTIEGELQTRTEDAERCAELSHFSCGDGRLDAEGVVESIVAEHHAGEHPLATLRVTRLLPSGSLVGLTAIEWKGVHFEHPLFPMAAYRDAAYVAVIALSAQYRGGYTSCDGLSLSDVLLIDVLRHICLSRNGTMPPVQALIAPDNWPSRNLFARYGFVQPIVTEPDLLYIRPRNLAVLHALG